MKKSLTKTIFYTLFYLVLAYFITVYSLTIEDFVNDFKVEDNWDKVNKFCITIFGFMVMLTAILLVCVAGLVVKQYIKNQGAY